MGTALNRDLPPYVIASGNYARPIGINKEGLKRRGFSPELIQALHKAFRLMIKSRKKDEAAIAELVEQWPEVARFKAFIDASQRGIIR
jgi:UDP-N-acetylglucosamine acyltransferase